MWCSLGCMAAQCIFCGRFTSSKSGGEATRFPGEYGGSIGEEWEWICRACLKKGRYKEARMVQKATLPEAVYPCANISCAVEVSWPPDMLFWWAGSDGAPAGFYCGEGEDPDDLGPTLKEELARRAEIGY